MSNDTKLLAVHSTILSSLELKKNNQQHFSQELSKAAFLFLSCLNISNSTFDYEDLLHIEKQFEIFKVEAIRLITSTSFTAEFKQSKIEYLDNAFLTLLECIPSIYPGYSLWKINRDETLLTL